MFAIRNILCPTDFSETSKAALQAAESIAREYHAPLTVLHVAEFPPVVATEGVLWRPLGYDADAVRRELEEIKPTDPAVAMEHKFARGFAAEEILRVATEGKFDLIVIGTHGRTGLGRLIMGSVAEEVIRKAPCPVLSVKTPVAETSANAVKELVEAAG